ncbi:MAG: DUF4129 domain-containing protein, partial [Dehalococcoidia bacterium]
PGLTTVPRSPQPQHGGPGLRAALRPLAFLDAESPRGRVLAAYFTAVRWLEARRRVSMRPSFTLRDFLAALGLRMGSAFADLTLLAEQALYASDRVDESDLRRAEVLVSRVAQEGA